MGLLPIVQMSLTVRFNLSEKDMNVLMIVQGISAIISVIVVGYLGSFHHKIRWITAGMVLTGSLSNTRVIIKGGETCSKLSTCVNNNAVICCTL